MCFYHSSVTMILCIFVLALATTVNSLNISIYYESLCPDSKTFIVEQFHTAYEDLKHDLSVNLIPFGKANVTKNDNDTIISCQHGPNECYGNKVHSCALFLNSENSTEFVICAMAAFNTTDTVLESCANQTNIDWANIKQCVDSGKGLELLLENGKKTKAVTPSITYIPTIIFQEFYNPNLQDVAEHHFYDTVCFLMQDGPPECQKRKNGEVEMNRPPLTLFLFGHVLLVLLKTLSNTL